MLFLMGFASLSFPKLVLKVYAIVGYFGSSQTCIQVAHVGGGATHVSEDCIDHVGSMLSLSVVRGWH